MFEKREDSVERERTISTILPSSPVHVGYCIYNVKIVKLLDLFPFLKYYFHLSISEIRVMGGAEFQEHRLNL